MLRPHSVIHCLAFTLMLGCAGPTTPSDPVIPIDTDLETETEVTAGNTTSLCAGGGYVENGETTGILCTSPLAAGTSSITNGTMTLHSGPVYALAP